MPDRARLFRGYRFPAEVIAHAVRLYLRFALSLRDVAELLAERGGVVSDETGRFIGPLHLEIGDAEVGLTAHARMRPYWTVAFRTVGCETRPATRLARIDGQNERTNGS